MNLYKLTQNVNTGWDTFEFAIVCAPNEDVARRICPDWSGIGGHIWSDELGCWLYRKLMTRVADNVWADHIDQVIVERIGTADGNIPMGVVVASYTAG